MIQHHNNLNKEVYLRRLSKILNDEFSTEQIYRMMDEIVFAYAQYVFQDQALLHNRKNEAARLYLLHMIRDLFKEIIEPCK